MIEILRSLFKLEKNEINLLGRRVDEALDLVDKFLDDAFLAQMREVRIVHGTGTGALRQAILELLGSHPHVGDIRQKGFMAGIELVELANIAQLASLADETPEGRSIVVLAKQYGIRGRELHEHERAEFVPFTAKTRMSGVDFDGEQYRKGAPDAIQEFVGGVLPAEISAKIEGIANQGGTPLVVASAQKVFGVVYLKDIVKGGLPDRFQRFRAMGIRTIMITGDNPMTAAAIAAEAGVDEGPPVAKVGSFGRLRARRLAIGVDPGQERCAGDARLRVGLHDARDRRRDVEIGLARFLDEFGQFAGAEAAPPVERRQPHLGRDGIFRSAVIGLRDIEPRFGLVGQQASAEREHQT